MNSEKLTNFIFDGKIYSLSESVLKDNEESLFSMLSKRQINDPIILETPDTFSNEEFETFLPIIFDCLKTKQLIVPAEMDNWEKLLELIEYFSFEIKPTFCKYVHSLQYKLTKEFTERVDQLSSTLEKKLLEFSTSDEFIQKLKSKIKWKSLFNDINFTQNTERIILEILAHEGFIVNNECISFENNDPNIDPEDEKLAYIYNNKYREVCAAQWNNFISFYNDTLKSEIEKSTEKWKSEICFIIDKNEKCSIYNSIVWCSEFREKVRFFNHKKIILIFLIKIISHIGGI